jgi:hypothetical protein
MTQSHTRFINKVDSVVRVASPKENRLLPNLLTIDTLYSIPDNIAIWQEYTNQGNRFMKLGALAQPPNPNTDRARTVYHRAWACCQKTVATSPSAKKQPRNNPYLRYFL